MPIRIERFMPLNWHYLSKCEPLPIGDTCFITGENASGKSSLLDAFRFLFFVSTNKFNSANVIGNKRSNRTLLSYVRGRIDMRNGEQEEVEAEFLRRGATVTHIVSQIRNTETNIPTVIGVTVELPAITDSNEIRPYWWLVDNCMIEELDFLVSTEQGRRYASLEEIRTNTPAGSSLKKFDLQKEVKLKFSVLFGLTDNRMGDIDAFDAWVRTQDNAIAFNPKDMSDINQFVKDLVVPKREIRTEEFRRLLDIHHDLQRTSDGLNNQCEKLKSVVESCEEYKEKAEQVAQMEILCALADEELLEMKIGEQHILCVNLEENIEELQAQTTQLADKKVELMRTKADLEASEENAAAKYLQEAIFSCNRDIGEAERKESALKRILEGIRSYAQLTESLFGSSVVDGSFLARYQTSQGPFKEQEEFFEKLRNSLANAHSIVETKAHQLEARKLTLRSSMSSTQTEIEELQKGLGVADNPSAPELKKAITAAFKENDIIDEPKFLCELLDYNDPSWAKAAEAYMAGYRFSIFVLPNHYRVAAKAYKDLCAKNQNIYGVTLVDSSSFLADESEAPENSLASIFSSTNPYAKAYVNYCYSHVQLTEDAAHPPSKNGTYISKDGMRYAGRGLTRMKPVKFLAIGTEARKNRLKDCIEDLSSIEKDYQSLSSEISKSKHAIDTHQTKAMHEFFANGSTLLREASTLPGLRNQLAKHESELKRTQSLSIQSQLKHIETSLAACSSELNTVNESLSAKKGELLVAQKECTESQIQLNICEEKISQWRSGNPTRFESAAEELHTRKSNTRRTIKGIKESAIDEAALIEKTLATLNFAISQSQKEYNQAFDTTYETLGYESMEEFRLSYNALSSSSIPEIKDKSDRAAYQTQCCFEDEIMGQLKANIRDAEKVMKAINKLMERMSYNGRTYQFARIKPAYGREEDYEMICNHNNVPKPSGQTSFESNEFEDQYATRRAQLFEAIEKSEDAKDRTRDLLDYRTYCQFGITVSDTSNPEWKNSLGDIVGSGSGAEVQVPCYIILTAALVQRYNRSNRVHGTINDSQSLRIMVIDECFDKMDGTNAKNMIEFISQKMGLQLIASAPTDKFTSIGTNMESIIFVKTDTSHFQRDCFYFSAPTFSSMIEEGEIDVFSEEGESA